MIRVIFNQKGGVGKSSITVNLAAIAAAEGKNVLVIDLDPQCNTSQYILGDFFNEARHQSSISDFFTDCLKFKIIDRDPLDYVHASEYPNLHIIPADPELYELMSKLENKHKIYKLRETLKKLSSFDEIYIDTPPAFNFFSLSALIAANTVLIPFDCDDFSRRALYSLIENIEETQSDHNPNLVLEGIIVNQFSAQAKLPQKIVDQLVTEKLPVMQTRLSSSVKMRESHDLAKPLIHMARSHKLSQQFIALYHELTTSRRR